MKISKRTIGGRLAWIADSGRSLKKRLIRRCETRDEAASLINSWERERAVMAEEWMILTDAEKVDAIRALRIARRGGFRLEECAQAYKQTPRESKRLSEAVSAFLRAKGSGGKRPTYVQTLKSRLEAFARGREAEQLDSITPQSVREFLDPTKYAPASLQGMRRRLATFFAWCLRHQLCSRNPMPQVDGVSVTQRPPEIFTVGDCERIMRAAEAVDRGLIPWLALGLFCGVRPEEIRRLTWSAVKLERGFVEISGEASKVRARRLVTISPNAKAWLALGGDLPPVNFWRRIRKLRAAAGLTEWPSDVLRHTAASMMLARDKDAARVALELGNSPEILFRHYRELVAPEDAARFWAIMPAS